MKLFAAPPSQPGDTRTVRKFLWLPRQFKRDWRWLEFAEVVEKLESGWFEPNFWYEVDFVDNRTQHLEEVERKQLLQQRINNPNP